MAAAMARSPATSSGAASSARAPSPTSRRRRVASGRSRLRAALTTVRHTMARAPRGGANCGPRGAPARSPPGQSRRPRVMARATADELGVLLAMEASRAAATPPGWSLFAAAMTSMSTPPGAMGTLLQTNKGGTGDLNSSAQHFMSSTDDEGVAMRRKRREYSAAERRELWDRWKRGESISDIGRALDRAPGTIHQTIRQHGGVVPSERRRGRLTLTVFEREEISRGVAAGESARRVAARLGRSPSTVTRELARHGGRRGYRAAEADKRAWANGTRPQICKLARNPALSGLVADKLGEDWSPEQIAGWLKTALVTFPWVAELLRKVRTPLRA